MFKTNKIGLMAPTFRQWVDPNTIGNDYNVPCIAWYDFTNPDEKNDDGVRILMDSTLGYVSNNDPIRRILNKAKPIVQLDDEDMGQHYRFGSYCSQIASTYRPRWKAEDVSPWCKGYADFDGINDHLRMNSDIGPAWMDGEFGNTSGGDRITKSEINLRIFTTIVVVRSDVTEAGGEDRHVFGFRGINNAGDAMVDYRVQMWDTAGGVDKMRAGYLLADGTSYYHTVPDTVTATDGTVLQGGLDSSSIQIYQHHLEAVNSPFQRFFLQDRSYPQNSVQFDTDRFIGSYNIVGDASSNQVMPIAVNMHVDEGAVGNSQFIIGGSAGGMTAQSWDGRIYEIIMFNGVLHPHAHVQLSNYLNLKYNYYV